MDELAWCAQARFVQRGRVGQVADALARGHAVQLHAAGLDVRQRLRRLVAQDVDLADDQLARKRFLTAAEQPFLAPAEAAPVYETPAGRMAVLVCADAFYPASYAALAGRQVRLLAVPSFLEAAGVWRAPWPGYNGAAAPADVAPRDVGAISERQAWLKYGMAGRIGPASIPYGVNVFLRGTILDLGSDGATLLYRRGELAEAPADGPALANVWLDSAPSG